MISSVGVSASGTLLENEIMFSPVARWYVMTIMSSIISMSSTPSGRCTEIVALDGSPE